MEGDIAALVSGLEAERYGAEPLERATANVAWLGARATEHDRVLTWASDRASGAVVPLPIFSLFRDEGSVRAMLRDRAGSFPVSSRAWERAGSTPSGCTGWMRSCASR
jgi:hypothetical protein